MCYQSDISRVAFLIQSSHSGMQSYNEQFYCHKTPVTQNKILPSLSPQYTPISTIETTASLFSIPIFAYSLFQFDPYQAFIHHTSQTTSQTDLTRPW